jgi:hypothetical protein
VDLEGLDLEFQLISIEITEKGQPPQNWHPKNQQIQGVISAVLKSKSPKTGRVISGA